MNYYGKAKYGYFFQYQILYFEQNISENKFEKIKNVFKLMGFNTSKLDILTVRKGYIYIYLDCFEKLIQTNNRSRCFRHMSVDELFNIEYKIKKMKVA